MNNLFWIKVMFYSKILLYIYIYIYKNKNSGKFEIVHWY